MQKMFLHLSLYEHKHTLIPYPKSRPATIVKSN